MNPKSKETHLHNGTTTSSTTADESIFNTSCYDLTDLSEALGFVESTTTTTSINYANKIPLVDTNPTLDFNDSAYDFSELRDALSVSQVADKKGKKKVRFNLKRGVVKTSKERKQREKEKKKKVQVFSGKGRQQGRFLLPMPDSDDIDAVMAFIEDLTQTSVDDLFDEFLK